MQSHYTLHGWHLSYYTGKVLCYLRYKQIAFEGPHASAWTLLRQIKRRFGAAVMPVLVTPQGEWIQDSGDIIAHLERRFPARSITPDDAVLRFASALMEAWGDEWWVPIAMHSRWSYPENYALFERDAGAELLPGFPAFLQRKAVAQVANGLRAMLHNAGVRSAQAVTMERWTCDMLDLLDAHFAVQPYLFGDAPLLGDFGLVGTMYGHLGRDPWPAREWVGKRPHLRGWIDRMAQVRSSGDGTGNGNLHRLPYAVIAPTLAPVFAQIFAEFTPYVAQTHAQVQAAIEAAPPGRLLRRSLDDVQLHTSAGLLERKALPFAVWKAQGVLDVFAALSEADRARVRAWAEPLGGAAFLSLGLVRLQRSGLRVRAAPVGEVAA